jgi:hypothetical protein
MPFTVSKVGEVALPARTKWGWDVLWLAAVTPASHVPREEAWADIRERRFEASRRIAFARWVERLAAAHAVQRDDTLLDQVEVDSLIEMP